MKKNTLWMLAALGAILGMIAVSCGDNKMPNVQIGFHETGGISKNGVLNICNGDTICIDEVFVVTQNSTPSTTIFRTDYYWDNVWVGERITPPFGFDFLVDVNRIGPHTLTIFNVVGANGYSLTNCSTTIPVYVHPYGTDLDSVAGK